jgi:hypothetical protein
MPGISSQRLVRRLLVERDRGEPQAPDVAEILGWGALEHPLELRLGGLEVAAVEVEARRYERAHRRV